MLAGTGIGSRRQVERWIREGRIVVNGKPAALGDQISGDERIYFDGRRIDVGRRAVESTHAHIAYYKPVGQVTTSSDTEGRKTVFSELPRLARGRWINVGRLDINTSGLIVFTTDGELAHRLMHPSYEISRQYAVRVLGELTDEQRKSLLEGVMLEDGPGRFEAISGPDGTGANRWYQVKLREGRNREVRRLFEAVGVVVSRLIRTDYGPVSLGKLRRGTHRRLSPGEIRSLYEAVRLDPDRDSQ